jgi:dolichyl-phosphate-mannose-protein mannosyltransferase
VLEQLERGDRAPGGARRAVESTDAGRRVRDIAAALFPWREVVVPWMVSRLLSATLIVATTPAGRAGVGTGAFSRWDGVWYLLIARSGYGHPPLGVGQNRWPFFPVLPGVIGVMRTLGIPGRSGVITVNHLAFLLALAGVWRIARRHTSDDASRLAVWALALFPAAFIFSMVYPSAIFLATSVWAFVLVEEHHDALAGMLAATAALTRPNGVVVAIALTIGVAAAASRPWWRVARVGGPAFLALGVWCVLCWHWTGNPIVFLTAKRGWHELSLADLVRHPIRDPNAYLHLALGVAAGIVVLLRRRRLPASWTLFSGLYLIPSLGLGVVGLGRYTNECFPPFVAAGELLEHTRATTRRRLFLIAVGLQAAGAWWILHLAHVP